MADTKLIDLPSGAPAATTDLVYTVKDPAGVPTDAKLTLGEVKTLIVDANLTSWAGVTRASGFDAFAATPSSTNLRNLLTDETGTGDVYFQGGNLGTPSAGVLTNATGLPVSTGISGLGTGVATFLATPSSANLASAVTDETGTGALVFATSPSLTTPNLGTPSAAVLTNATGLPVSTGISGLGANVATFLATPSSANLASAVTDETGTGALVFATSPSLTTPNLGTPSAAVLTNATGLPVSTGISGLGTGVATFLATPSSANLAAAVTGETGTGALVFATSPSLTTPNLGTPSAAVLTNATGLPVSTGISGLGTGVATFLATPSSANLAAAVTDETGSGSLVFATSPSLTTPNLGTPSAGTLTNCSGLPVSGITASTTSALGVGSIELGHASDTTISRSSAGNIAIEGNVVYRSGGTDVSLADGGTGASLADPNADRIMFWDDSAGSVTWLELGVGLSITGTVISSTGGTGGISDGDYGDITVSSSGTVWTVDNQAITYAKIQNVSATDKILGRASVGAGTIEEITCTAAGRALLDDATAADQRTTLGLGTADTPQFTGVEVGNASDTTLTRASAGDIAVEGNLIYRAGGTDVPLADGGTGASLTDPNADRLMFWDDSAGAVTWLEPTKGISVVGTTLVPAREVLTADRTYYVRTDGSNSNDGLTNTSGGAFLTLQKAMDVIASDIDLGPYNVTIQVASGTYTAGLSLKTYRTTSGIVNVRGDTTTPSNVVLSVTGNCFSNASGASGYFDIRGFKVTNVTSGFGMNFSGPFMDIAFGNIDFGSTVSRHLDVSFKARATAVANFDVSGGSTVGFWAGRQGLIRLSGRTITYSNSPNFSARHFAATEQGWVDAFSMTFTNGGTVTGKRYEIDTLGGIYVAGGGANYLPGSVAGTTANNGIYV